MMQPKRSLQLNSDNAADVLGILISCFYYKIQPYVTVPLKNKAFGCELEDRNFAAW